MVVSEFGMRSIFNIFGYVNATDHSGGFRPYYRVFSVLTALSSLLRLELNIPSLPSSMVKSTPLNNKHNNLRSSSKKKKLFYSFLFQVWALTDVLDPNNEKPQPQIIKLESNCSSFCVAIRNEVVSTHM